MARLTSQGPTSTEPRLLDKPMEEMSDDELREALARIRGARSMVPRSGDRVAGVKRQAPIPTNISDEDAI